MNLRSIEKTQQTPTSASRSASPDSSLAADILAGLAKLVARDPEILSRLTEQIDSGESAVNDTCSLSENGIGVPAGFPTTRRKAMLRVDGPFRHGRRFRIRIRENGVQQMESFDTEAAAVARQRKLQRTASASATVTVAEALDAYKQHLEAKGNKTRSVEVTIQRLKVTFRQALDVPVSTLSDGKQKLTDSLEQYRTERGKPLSVDSKHNLVNQGRTFLKWCIGKDVLKDNPLVGVQIIGKRHRGKPQLTADEGARFLAKALELADEALAGRHTGRRMNNMNQLEGSIAAACCLWLGPRASEVSERVIRDLDCHGSVLIIPESKTAAGVRRLNVPVQLQPYLQRLVEGRSFHEKLFGQLADRGAIYRWVRRICKLADIPVVPPHGLRGTHGTLAREGGSTVDAVSQVLGHASTGVTLAHYIQPSADLAAKQRRVEAVLAFS